MDSLGRNQPSSRIKSGDLIGPARLIALDLWGGRVLLGREGVDGYRYSHQHLYNGGWHKGISEEHTPLLNKLKGQLSELGFNSLEEFFAVSEEQGGWQ